MRTFHLVLQSLALALVATPTIVLAEVGDDRPSTTSGTVFELSTGVIYQEGDFGTEDKFETLAVPVAVTATEDQFRFGASLPYMRTTAPVGVIVSQGGLLGTPLFATNQTTQERTSREGIGDLTLQAAVDLPVAGFATSIGTSVKLPTASSAKGLGTGKVDYSISGQVARPMGDITPFATLGYTVLGKPDGFDVRNTFGGSAGARVDLSRRTFAAVSYSYEQAATRALADRQVVGVGIGTALTDKLRISVQGDAGLTKGAPDASMSARIGFGF